jgi:AcrR family transcriptional regulator
MRQPMSVSTAIAEKGADESPRTPPVRRPRADQRRLSRQRLIDAARQMCAEGRFLSCAVSDIAAKAAISRAGFYLHFKSKEDLLGAVMSDQLDWYVNQHNTMTEARAASLDGIVGWLRQFVAGFRNAGELLVQFWMANPTLEIIRQQQANRMKGVEALGHRIPALGMFGPDGAVDADRQRRVLLYVYQLEQACMAAAYGEDRAETEATLLLLAEEFQRLMVRQGR